MIQFNQLLRACAESPSALDERKAFAEQIVQRMLQRGIVPSDGTLQALKWTVGSARFREIYSQIGAYQVQKSIAICSSSMVYDWFIV